MRISAQHAVEMESIPVAGSELAPGQRHTQEAPLSPQSGAVLHHTRHSIVDLLQRHHITPTRQRIAIAHILFSSEQHLSADQILSKINVHAVKLSRATVYNTLKVFLAKKLIRELIIDPARIFYDRNTRPHHHFYDMETGTLTDIPADCVQIHGLPELPAGNVIDCIEIIVRTRRKA